MMIRSLVVVEDDPLCRLVESSLVRKSGLVERLVFAEDADAALALLDCGRCPRPAVILVDIRMPRADGFDLVDMLRARLNSCPAPPLVYILSSSSDTDDMRRGDADPLVRGIFQKPLSIDHLRTIDAATPLSAGAAACALCSVRDGSGLRG